MFCKSCEREIVLPILQIKTKNNFMFVNLTKRVNNQTNCCIALEILKKIWICLVVIYIAVKKANSQMISLFVIWHISKVLNDIIVSHLFFVHMMQFCLEV